MPDLFAGRGLDLIYIAKVWLAAVLTYFLALWLDVPQPQTALISVFILMQPHSGAVLAKSLYRLLGTACGMAMAVLLMALLGQQGELFIAALALWVGLCCALATRYRGFTAYSCVLAGYTAAIVGAPALANPDAVVLAALWRGLEIGLAIVCCGSVSAVLLPRHSASDLQHGLARRLGHLAGIISDGLAGAASRAAQRPAQRQLASEAVAWEQLLHMAAWEDPRWGARQAGLRRLNAELMALATTFNALLHWLDALSVSDRQAVAPHLAPLIALLEQRRRQPLHEQNAKAFARQLISVPPAAAHNQAQATALRLLHDLRKQLRRSALAHALLAQPARARFEALSSPWLSLAAGLRGTLLVAALGGFWYLSAWPSGAAMLLSAAAAVSLASTTPNPRETCLQMFQGALLGSLLAFIDTLYVYPRLDGFALLAIAIAPPILYGAWLTTRLPTLGIGLGLLVTFASVAIPGNVPVYDPAALLDNCLATLVSFGAAAVAGAVLLPSNAPWSWQRLQQALAAELTFAASAPLPQLRQRLESRTRDVLQQASVLAASAPAVQAQLLDTALTTQMTGLAIIEVRQGLRDDAEARALMPALHALARGEVPAWPAAQPADPRARDYWAWCQG